MDVDAASAVTASLQPYSS